MPRQARVIAESGFYHLILKGNGSWVLFEDSVDMKRFVQQLKKSFDRYETQLIAWCLMSNHVHLIICEREGLLAQAMQSLMTAYAHHLNERQGRSGHVFEDRYWRVPIEDDGQLLEAVRYVHNNPEKAGICDAKDYYWSSYGEYAGMRNAIKAADTTMILEMLGGPRQFMEFCSLRFADTYSPYKGHRIPDDEAVGLATAALGGRNPRSIGEGEASERVRDIRALADVGLNKTQITRCTGLGRWTIMKALGEG
ncbi:transposase [Paratractidigestivibacter sp.]|uniref:transposase n=1 Tax=Paratractidigestivibacter sp. TaxID=2847316 RepID=UPI002ABD91DF|nr:transposase [Paratractidigestivibacter sp.]